MGDEVRTLSINPSLDISRTRGTAAQTGQQISTGTSTLDSTEQVGNLKHVLQSNLNEKLRDQTGVVDDRVKNVLNDGTSKETLGQDVEGRTIIVSRTMSTRDSIETVTAAAAVVHVHGGRGRRGGGGSGGSFVVNRSNSFQEAGLVTTTVHSTHHGLEVFGVFNTSPKGGGTTDRVQGEELNKGVNNGSVVTVVQEDEVNKLVKKGRTVGDDINSTSLLDSFNLFFRNIVSSQDVSISFPSFLFTSLNFGDGSLGVDRGRKG